MPGTADVIDRVRALARGSGVEICGALLADDHGICDAVPLINHSSTPAAAFFIPATDIRRIERDAERQGRRLAGFYHSHPHGMASPSASDLDLALPGYTYWIATREEVRAWRLREDRSAFDEVTIS